MALEIEQCVIFEKVFLFDHVHFGQRPKLPEMWPAIVIVIIYLEVTTLRQKAAHRNMHEILLLLLRKLMPDVPVFLYPYEEKYAFKIRFLAETLNHLLFKFPPSRLKVIVREHTANIAKDENAYDTTTDTRSKTGS
jgi:hypothetical protein